MADDDDGGVVEPVGMLTAASRDVWAAARIKLMEGTFSSSHRQSHVSNILTTQYHVNTTQTLINESIAWGRVIKRSYIIWKRDLVLGLRVHSLLGAWCFINVWFRVSPWHEHVQLARIVQQKSCRCPADNRWFFVGQVLPTFIHRQGNGMIVFRSIPFCRANQTIHFQVSVSSSPTLTQTRHRNTDYENVSNAEYKVNKAMDYPYMVKSFSTNHDLDQV